MKTKFNVLDAVKREKEALVNTAKPKEDKHKVQPFPVHGFPDSIQEIIRETNDKLKFPIDFIGASLLYVSATAIGNSYNVKVKNDWFDSSILFMAIVGRAGTNKSHPLSWAMKPMYQRQKELFKSYKEEQEEHGSQVKKSKGKGELQELDRKKPVLKKLVVSDSTPEQLASILSQNEKGIGVCVDELNGWLSSFNQYNNGNEEEFWLSLWSGKPITIDRKSSPPIYIPKPYASVCGTMQTGILENLIKGNKGVNGFIDRVLMIMPDGLKKESLNELELSNAYSERWQRLVSKLLELEGRQSDDLEFSPNYIGFDSEAKKMLRTWVQLNTDLINKTENEDLKGVYTKLETYCIRFSLILYVLNCICNSNPIKEIDSLSVSGAIELVNYFQSTAEATRILISDANPLDKLDSSKKKFFETLPDTVTLQDAYQLKEDSNKFKFSKSTIRRLLNNTKFFKRSSHGLYEKVT